MDREEHGSILMQVAKYFVCDEIHRTKRVWRFFVIWWIIASMAMILLLSIGC